MTWLLVSGPVGALGRGESSVSPGAGLGNANGTLFVGHLKPCYNSRIEYNEAGGI